MNKQSTNEQKEYSILYFDAPKLFLENPEFSPQYMEAYLKPDKTFTSEYCENTTAYD